MMQVTLSRGELALVDSEDYELVSNFKWHVSRRGYVSARVPGSGEPGRKLLMHRIIVGALPTEMVDHKNRNKLDNRRANLRIVTKSENGRNRPKQRNNTSGYKGVVRDRTRWAAMIKLHGKKIYLGCFGSPEEAAKAYDAAAIKYHGVFARGNFS